MKLSFVKVALFTNANLATLMADVNGWLSGGTTGGASAAAALPVVSDQTFLDIQWYINTGPVYGVLISYTN